MQREDVKVHSVVDICVQEIVGRTLIHQYNSPTTDVKLDRTPQAVNAIMEDLLIGSSPEDLSDILFEDGDSLAIENMVFLVRTETPEIPPGHPMDEELAILEPLLLCPGIRTPSSVDEFPTLYPCSCAADAVEKPTKPTLRV